MKTNIILLPIVFLAFSVINNMTHIKSKLGIANITGLTRLAIRLGIINP